MPIVVEHGLPANLVGRVAYGTGRGQAAWRGADYRFRRTEAEKARDLQREMQEAGQAGAMERLRAGMAGGMDRSALEHAQQLDRMAAGAALRDEAEKVAWERELPFKVGQDFREADAQRRQNELAEEDIISSHLKRHGARGQEFAGGVRAIYADDGLDAGGIAAALEQHSAQFSDLPQALRTYIATPARKGQLPQFPEWPEGEEPGQVFYREDPNRPDLQMPMRRDAETGEPAILRGYVFPRSEAELKVEADKIANVTMKQRQAQEVQRAKVEQDRLGMLVGIEEAKIAVVKNMSDALTEVEPNADDPPAIRAAIERRAEAALTALNRLEEQIVATGQDPARDARLRPGEYLARERGTGRLVAVTEDELATGKYMRVGQ